MGQLEHAHRPARLKRDFILRSRTSRETSLAPSLATSSSPTSDAVLLQQLESLLRLNGSGRRKKKKDLKKSLDELFDPGRKRKNKSARARKGKRASKAASRKRTNTQHCSREPHDSDKRFRRPEDWVSTQGPQFALDQKAEMIK